jgi:hypothetical protein
MGYSEEVQAGYRFVPLTPRETCPAADCARITQAHVRFVAPAGTKRAHIKAFCSACGFRRELNLKRYGPLLLPHFPEIAEYLKQIRPPKRSKTFETGSPEFFARFDWCCVYCEGFRLAREYRLKQIAELESGSLANRSLDDRADELELALETRTSDMIGGGRALQNIFDLVPDHIFPVWVQQLPDLAWEDEAKFKAERAWVVSAHRSCNSKRRKRLESADFLLFIYSRYLFPTLQMLDKQRLQDTLLFADVLHRIEVLKEQHHITELKPNRRAV